MLWSSYPEQGTMQFTMFHGPPVNNANYQPNLLLP